MTARASFILAMLSVLTWTRAAMAHDFCRNHKGAFALRYGHRGGEALPLDAGKLKALSCRKDGGAHQNLFKSAVPSPRQISLTATCALLSAFP